METAPPNVIVLAGPNGAGKSTISTALMSTHLNVPHFVNADTIARGLSEFHSEDMAFKAGKIMLEHLHDLAALRSDFAFETTLATRTFAPWLKELQATGYVCKLFFVWLPSADIAIQRVRDRVANGGHHVPDETVRRRYQRGLHNFFHLYEPFVDHWIFYDNSQPANPKQIARKDDKITKVLDAPLWTSIRAGVGL